MSDSSFGEVWDRFVNGKADWRELVLASNKKFIRFEPEAFGDGVWIFEATGAWCADSLRIIADELDRRASETPPALRRGGGGLDGV